LFLEGAGRFIGPGHANIWSYTDEKARVHRIFSHHYYDGGDVARPGRAKMHTRELVFDEEGWPRLTKTVFYKM
jgi:hypothetical protein